MFSAARIHHLCWWASAQGWNINKQRPSGFGHDRSVRRTLCVVGTWVVSGGGTVFWHTVGSWINRPGAFPSGVFRFGFFWFPAHGLSRTVRTRKGVCVGGGCDGVVVWELYSGREHLVKQDQEPVAFGSAVFLSCFA